VPAGDKITISGGKLSVPDHPVLPFIEGDGTGPDIWRASVRVFDAAVAKCYGGRRKIHWLEVDAGERPILVPEFEQDVHDLRGHVSVADAIFGETSAALRPRRRA